MFLRFLNNEQKPLFLGLAYYAANANGIVVEEEKKLIKGFSEDLGIEESDYSQLGFTEICKKLVSISTRRELIQITFEILGVMMGDTIYDEKEKNFVKQMVDIFDISEQIVTEMEVCIEEYTNIYKKIDSITRM